MFRLPRRGERNGNYIILAVPVFAADMIQDEIGKSKRGGEQPDALTEL